MRDIQLSVLQDNRTSPARIVRGYGVGCDDCRRGFSCTPEHLWRDADEGLQEGEPRGCDSLQERTRAEGVYTPALDSTDRRYHGDATEALSGLGKTCDVVFADPP